MDEGCGLMDEGDQKDTQGEKEQVGRQEGDAIGTHILLGIAEGLARQVFLHHILVQSCHHHDDKDAAKKLFPEIVGRLPVIEHKDAAQFASLHNINGFADRQVHHGDDLEDDENESGKETEGLEGIGENQRGDAAATGIEPYEQYHSHNIHHEGDAHRVEDKLLEYHADNVELHG